MYNKVDTSLDFVSREKAVKDFWEKNGIFEKSMKLRDSSFCQSISLKVNYNFDFGHKKVEHNEVRVDKNISNSILK